MNLEALRTDMANNGYKYHGNFEFGSIKRFDTKKQGDKNGWYVVHDNGGFYVAEYGDWVSGVKINWKSTGESLTRKEQKQIKQTQEQYKKQLLADQQQAKVKAQNIYNEAEQNTLFNEYLKNKGFDKYPKLEHPARQGKNGELIIPLYNKSNDIVSLQTIYPNGDKRLFKGGVKKGSFCLLGNISSITKEIYICEGYATALTVYLAFDFVRPVVFAVDNGNLEAVITHFKNSYPNKQIINCADNDHAKEQNAGIEKAKYLKQKYNIPFVYPDFIEGSDFDDLRQEKGLNEVQNIISNVVIDEQVFKEKEPNFIDKVLAKLELVKSIDDTAYATLPTGQTVKVKSSIFRDYLSHEYRSTTGGYIKDNAIKDVIHNINGEVMFKAKKKEIFKRVGYSSDKTNIYIDLADDNFNVIKVNAKGWEVVQSKSTGIRFETTKDMQPLPQPKQKGDISKLWKYTNIKDENQQKLALAWIINCFIPFSGYPVLVLTGGEGTAKSTTQYNLRELIDPSLGNLRMKSSGSDFLPIQAKNNYIVSLENLGSGKNNLTPTEQDQLCTISTGGAISGRKKYTDDEESLQVVKNPIMLNGITGFISQQDLLSRSVVLKLSKIDDTIRKTDSELKDQFIQDKAEIFGALLNILSKVLHVLPSVNVHNLPRMAEYGKIGTALESVMGWDSGDFLATYKQYQDDVAMKTLESEPVISVLLYFLDNLENTHIVEGYYNNGYFEGLWNTLIKELKRLDMRNGVNLDKLTPRGLSAKLEKNATALRNIGVIIDTDIPRTNKGFKVKITKTK
jgi:phage/plasmid primase-like uncharacterized protein